MVRMHSYGWLILLVLFPNIASDNVPCKIKGGLCGCSFINDNGEYMEISMAALDRNDGYAYFQEIQGRGEWVFYLNLCTGFSKPNGCSNVTACQMRQPGTEVHAMGKPGSQEFGNYTVGKPVVVKYTAFDEDIKRHAILNLICSEDVESAAIFIDEVDDKQSDRYYFNITSKHLCPGKASTSGKPRSNGLSTGSVMVIVFCVLLFTYFLSGMLFMKYRRGATGREIIPNINFWSSLPGLIKDGCVFFGKEMTHICRSDGYNEV